MQTVDFLDNVSMSLLNKDLDGLWARQQAISDNIANVETPGYHDKSVSFEDQLRAQLQDPNRTEQQTIDAIRSVEPQTVTSTDTLRADGNGVDLEQQNLDLARTQLNYYTSLQEISDSFSRLKTAIGGSQN